MVTSAYCRHRRRRNSRSALTEKCHLAALVALVVLAVCAPARAVDSIEELLKQDEIGENDEVRRDLNALTEEQWEYYFKIGGPQTDIELGGQLTERKSKSHLIERESEEHIRVVYIWLAVLVAAFGTAIGAFKAWPSVRHGVLTLALPVHMKDPSFASLRPID
jgi:hypothetical protein